MKNEKVTLSGTDKLNFISNLSAMIGAGIPILSAIGSLLEDSRGNVKIILEAIRTDLLAGKHLYMSFARFPKVFDSITVNMIRASEETGSLDASLRDLKQQIKDDIAFNKKIRAALTYPALVMIVFFGVLFMILIVVIPKIALVFTQLKVKLPLPTKILIFMSNVVLHQTLLFILGILLIIAVFVLLYRSKRDTLMRTIYSLPLLTKVVKNIDLMRFSRSLHLLLSSGISITNALSLTEDVVRKKEVSHAIGQARQAILSGKTLSSSFKQHKKIFPGTMIELVRAGERTGSLDRSMAELAEYFDYKVTDELALVTTLLEPIMLVFVALLVGSMMAAIIGPIYGLIGQIGGH